MAILNKEADRNVKNDAAPIFPEQPQVELTSVNLAEVPANSAPKEKPAVSARLSPPEARSNAEGRTYLDSGSKISGKLWFEGTIRIGGQVDGEITVKESLVIGESAVVTAQINANSTIIGGQASGDIIATQRLELRPSARVTGNVTSPVLIVHEGARLEGRCSMQPEGPHEDGKLAVFPKEERIPQIASK